MFAFLNRNVFKNLEGDSRYADGLAIEGYVQFVPRIKIFTIPVAPRNDEAVILSFYFGGGGCGARSPETDKCGSEEIIRDF